MSKLKLFFKTKKSIFRLFGQYNSAKRAATKKQKQEKRKERFRAKQIIKQNWQAKYNPYDINFLNVWVKFPKKVLFTFLSAFLFNLGVATFLSKAAVVATGTSSLTQLITFSLDWNQYFAYFYALINLPLIIFFWKKNPRLFMVLTCYWLIFQIISQLILGQIQAINQFLTETITIYSPKGHEYWTAFNPKNVDNLNAPGYYDGQTWPIFVYAIIGGCLEGISSVIAWKQGGCVTGSNVIIYYISRVKKVSVGKIAFLVSAGFATFSIIVLGSLEITNHIPSRYWNYNWYEQHDSNPATKFIVRIVCTVIFIGVYSFVIEKLYPKYKKIRIEVYSKNTEKIAERFKKIHFNHTWNTFYVINSRSNREIGRLEVTGLYLEKDWIIAQITAADPNAWISVLPIHQVKGRFDTSYID